MRTSLPPFYDSSAAFYASLPLPDRHIRVLDLDALSKGEDDSASLRGNIRVVDLATNPRYSTLSYHWGASASSSHALECWTFSLPISSALHEALVHLRSLFGSLTIWIDAVCINQNDDREKAKQIPLMGEIYTWAELGYVWLGPGDPESDTAMDTISGIGAGNFTFYGSELAGSTTASLISASKMFLWDCARMLCTWISSHRTRNYPFYASDPSIPLLVDLLSRSWLTRAWTYQEIILSSRPVIVCGGKALQWNIFTNGLCALQYKLCRYSRPTLVDQAIEPWLATIKHWRYLERECSRNSTPVRRKIRSSYGRTSSFYVYHSQLAKLHKWFFLALSVIQFSCGFVCFYFGLRYLIGRGSVGDILFDFSFKNSSGEYTFGWWNITIRNSSGLYSIGHRFPNGTYDDSREWEKAPYVAAVRHQWLVQGWVVLSMCLVAFPLMLCFADIAYVPDHNKINADAYHCWPMLLHAIRHRKCHEPRDRSYAFYGLLGREVGEANGRLSEPSYQKPYSAVCRELMVDLLRCNPWLLCSLLDCCGEPVEGAPSWVPNWSVAPYRSWITDEYFDTMPPTRASNRSLYHYAISNDELKLKVFGIRPLEASIFYVSSKLNKEPQVEVDDQDDEPGIQDLLSPEFCDNIDCLSGFINQAFSQTRLLPESDTFRRDLAETCVPQLFNSSQKSDLPPSWIEVMRTIIATRTKDVTSTSPADGEPSSSRVPASASSPGFYSRALATLLKYPAALSYHRKITELAASQHRVFCIILTSGGAYIGTGVPAMKPDDIVVLISGVPVPMVLRKSESWAKSRQEYQVIGPVLIPGMMKGELWRWKDNSPPKDVLTEFQLE